MTSRERRLSAPNNPVGHQAAPAGTFQGILPATDRMKRVCSSERVENSLEFHYLMGSRRLVDSLERSDRDSVHQIMVVSCRWAKFLREASFEEAELALPLFNRFVDSVSRFASESDPFSATQCVSALENLIHREPEKISHSLATILDLEQRPEVREKIISVLEKNLAFLLNPTCLYALGELMREYENGPDSFNPSVAMAASAFIFAWKDNIMLEEREGLLAYAVAWAHTIPESRRISLMHELVLRRKGSAADIIARAADMSILDSEVQREAVDLLIRMGAHKCFFTTQEGGKAEARMVNMLLEERLLEDVLLRCGESLVGKTIQIGQKPHLIVDLRAHLH